LAFVVQARHKLKLFQYFGIHCSYLPQGEHLRSAFTLKTAHAMQANTLKEVEHVTELEAQL
jgi:hypothetical protein